MKKTSQACAVENFIQSYAENTKTKPERIRLPVKDWSNLYIREASYRELLSRNITKPYTINKV